MNITGIKGVNVLSNATNWKNSVKFNKRQVILITLGILAVAAAVLYTVYMRQIDERDQVKDELATTEEMLNSIQTEQLASSKLTLEQQLEEMTAQFEAANVALSQPVERYTMTTTVFDIADEHAMQITLLKLTDEVSGTLGDIPCSITSLQIAVEGDADNIVAFVSSLNSSFITGMVDSIKITNSEVVGENASAEMVLSVYSREG